MLRIALIAPPGGGKGTQAEKICHKFNIPHISTGEIFRGIIDGSYSSGYPIEDITTYMEKGTLVPDSLVIEVLLDRLNKKDCSDGYLLDGFPRGIKQAKIFENRSSKAINKIVYLDVNLELLEKRLTGRRSCLKCGSIYNVNFNPSKIDGVCDRDGNKLFIRKDDNVETVRKRLEVYHNETAPLIEYYKNKGILNRINGDQSVEGVFGDIMEVLGS